jgi:hypothetical protein
MDVPGGKRVAAAVWDDDYKSARKRYQALLKDLSDIGAELRLILPPKSLKGGAPHKWAHLSFFDNVSGKMLGAARRTGLIQDQVGKRDAYASDSRGCVPNRRREPHRPRGRCRCTDSCETVDRMAGRTDASY